ncbi:MAG: tetratricopeptide repeat protein [Acholeplasmataceae bacterium]|nr:tetratricopeptide repeat protein [Acholeplasmataceae bacterium]
MEYNVSPIRDFLWESYEVLKNCEYYNSLSDCKENEKRERSLDHALDNLLLARSKRDPGFNLYIREKYYANPVLQERVRLTVLDLFSKTSSLSYDIDPLKPRPHLLEIEKWEGDPHWDQNKLQSEYRNYLATRLASEEKRKLEYLQVMLDDAENRMDTAVEKLVIRQAMVDHGTGKYFGSLLSTKNPLFPYAESPEQYYIQEIGYGFRNLKFRGLYFGMDGSRFERPQLMACIVWQDPSANDLEKLLFGKSMDVPPEEKVCIQDELWKFIADLNTISVYEWIVSLSREEKRATLNADYPFKLTDQVLEEIYQYDNKSAESIAGLATNLMMGKYYEYGINAAKYAYKKLNKGKTKKFLPEAISRCYKELGDKKNAEQWLQTAHPEVRRNQNQAIGLKDIHPPTLEYYCEMARAFHLQFQYDEELNLLLEAEKHYDDLEVRQEIGTLYQHKREYGLAISYYEAAIAGKRLNHDRIFCQIVIALLKTKCDTCISDETIELIRRAVQGILQETVSPTESLSILTRPIIFEIGFWDNEKLALEFLQFTVEVLRETGVTPNPEFYFGRIFTEHGILKDARYWFEQALPHAATASERAAIYQQLGHVYLADGDNRQARIYFTKALQDDPDSEKAHLGLVFCYINEMEYDSALNELVQLQKMSPQNSKYIELAENIKALNSGVIGVKRISSIPIKKIFATGDWLLMEVFKGEERGEYDLGPVLVQYGKGTERLLYENVLKNIRQAVRNDSEFIQIKENGETTIIKKYWKGDKNGNIPQLPNALKGILGIKEKTLALGQWGRLEEDLKAYDNPLVKKISNLLEESGYGPELLNKIGGLCADLANDRNGAAHSTFYTREDVMKKREEIVAIVNYIIDIVVKSA